MPLRAKAILAVLLMASFPRAAGADDQGDNLWTASDTAYEAAFVGMVFLDWQQTRWALEQAEPRFREDNPLLGERPSKERLDLSVLGVVVGHAVVAAVLPPRYRRAWQAVGLVVEVAAVGRNSATLGGLRFSF